MILFCSKTVIFCLQGPYNMLRNAKLDGRNVTYQLVPFWPVVKLERCDRLIPNSSAKGPKQVFNYMTIRFNEFGQVTTIYNLKYLSPCFDKIYLSLGFKDIQDVQEISVMFYRRIHLIKVMKRFT